MKNFTRKNRKKERIANNNRLAVSIYQRKKVANAKDIWESGIIFARDHS